MDSPPSANVPKQPSFDVPAEETVAPAYPDVAVGYMPHPSPTPPMQSPKRQSLQHQSPILQSSQRQSRQQYQILPSSQRLSALARSPINQSPPPQSSMPPTVSPKVTSPGKLSLKSERSIQIDQKSLNLKSAKMEEKTDIVTSLEPQGNIRNEHGNALFEPLIAMSKEIDTSKSPVLGSNIDKIATMGKILTKEANALRESIKSLSDDIVRTKKELCIENKEDVNFPYHLFLIEIVINKIHMKCECFEIDYNHLVISACFLGKQPIVLFDSSYGKVDNLNKLNAGKSILFAMTYDKICSIKKFEIILHLVKQPPCSTCVTKIGETCMDFTDDFVKLREELCRKWMEEQPNDNILCTTSTPLSKNLYYLSCGDEHNMDSIGVIEVTVRMSFLGKEITTAFCASPKPQGTSVLLKQDNGMTMYSCQKVEMDDQGKILLDEDVMTRKVPRHNPTRTASPISQLSSALSSKRSVDPPCMYSNNQDYYKYDEIFTKINANELKIRVPKSSKVERMGNYDKIQELCSCESTPYNTGEQIQFELPRDLCNRDRSHNTFTSNLKYSYKGCNRACGAKDNKIVNITPTNCPVPVDMEKVIHPLKDVFILKIGKKLETSDKKTDLEIELVTPKAPPEKTVDNAHIALQCSKTDMEDKKNDKKKKNKDKGKGKGNKKGKGNGTKPKKK